MFLSWISLLAGQVTVAQERVVLVGMSRNADW
jgi:hypothetical protein